MSVFVVSGDEALVGLEVGALLDQLCGDGDRSLLVEDFNGSDADVSIAAIGDALCTPPLFTDKRVVVVRNATELAGDDMSQFVDYIAEMDPTADLVIAYSGRAPKSLTDACKAVQATNIGASVGTSARDRADWVEAHLVEANLKVSADAIRLITTWLGGDHSRLAGLVDTLLSTYGESAKLTREHVEMFLGEAGSVQPWDLTDAIDDGNATRAIQMLHRLMGPGESHPLQILAMLTNRYTQMMRLDGRDVHNSQQASEVLGIKEFPARKLFGTYQAIGGSGVAQAVTWMAQADLDLRGGKDWEPELVMEVLVARLARLGASRMRPERTTSRS